MLYLRYQNVEILKYDLIQNYTAVGAINKLFLPENQVSAIVCVSLDKGNKSFGCVNYVFFL